MILLLVLSDMSLETRWPYLQTWNAFFLNLDDLSFETPRKVSNGIGGSSLSNGTVMIKKGE